jgi:hypothetical protein
MAWFIPLIPYAISAAGAVYGVVQQNKAAKKSDDQATLQRIAAEQQAAELDRQANAEQGSAQRAALEERRKASILASRATAVAGSSGGGVNDPSVQNLIGDIQGEGAYRSAVQLYQGDESARQLRTTASNARITGYVQAENTSAAAGAYRAKAMGTAISGASSLYQKYSNGGFGGSNPDNSAITGNGWNAGSAPG